MAYAVLYCELWPLWLYNIFPEKDSGHEMSVLISFSTQL